jgi:hypothetical protein
MRREWLTGLIRGMFTWPLGERMGTARVHAELTHGRGVFVNRKGFLAASF